MKLTNSEIARSVEKNAKNSDIQGNSGVIDGINEI